MPGIPTPHPRRFAAILLALGASAVAAGAREPTTTTARRGLYVMTLLPATERQFQQLETTLRRNDLLAGIYIHATWRDLETGPGDFQWGRLDRVVGIAAETDKGYALGCGGYWFPDYLSRAGMATFSYVEDNPHDRLRYGKTQEMPLPWDKVWQAGYARMLTRLGERYSGDPRCRSIEVTVSRTDEMHFPRQPADLARWAAYGDYRSKIEAAYEKFIDIAAKSFPRQQIVLMVSQMFDRDDAASSDISTIAAIVDYGLKRYPGRFTLQTDQLDGRRDDTGKLSYDIILRYGARLHHGFQSVASFKTTPRRQGSVEMAVYNFLQAGGEYWELWHGDGADERVCARVDACLAEAGRLGLPAYREKLVEEGLFRTADDDTYAAQMRAAGPDAAGPAK